MLSCISFSLIPGQGGDHRTDRRHVSPEASWVGRYLETMSPAESGHLSGIA